MIHMWFIITIASFHLQAKVDGEQKEEVKKEEEAAAAPAVEEKEAAAPVQEEKKEEAAAPVEEVKEEAAAPAQEVSFLFPGLVTCPPVQLTISLPVVDNEWDGQLCVCSMTNLLMLLLLLILLLMLPTVQIISIDVRGCTGRCDGLWQSATGWCTRTLLA